MIEALKLIKHNVTSRIVDHYQPKYAVEITDYEYQNYDNVIKFKIKLMDVNFDVQFPGYTSVIVKIWYYPAQFNNDIIEVTISFGDNGYYYDKAFEQSIEYPNIFDDMSNKCYGLIIDYFSRRHYHMDKVKS